MSSKSKSMVLVAGLVLAMASAGNTLADSPGSRVLVTGHHQAHRVQHIQRHRPAYNYRRHGPRAGSRGSYRGASRHIRRAPPRLRRGYYRYPRGAHVYYTRHSHRRGVDTGAVVAGLIVGRLVYGLLNGDSHDDYSYEEAYYDH